PQAAIGLRAAERIERVVVDRRRLLERAADVQPPCDLRAAVGVQPPGPEPASGERLMAAVEIETEAALPHEVETDAGHHLTLRSVLRAVVRGRGPHHRRDALDPVELPGRI